MYEYCGNKLKSMAWHVHTTVLAMAQPAFTQGRPRSKIATGTYDEFITHARHGIMHVCNIQVYTTLPKDGVCEPLDGLVAPAIRLRGS